MNLGTFAPGYCVCNCAGNYTSNYAGLLRQQKRATNPGAYGAAFP